MGIRKVFLLSLALGSAIGGMGSLLFAAQRYASLCTARDVLQDTRLLAAALRLPEALNIERAYVNARLLAPAPGSPAQMLVVGQQTARADAAIATVLDRAEHPADRASLRAATDSLDRLRHEALEAIAQPQSRRPPGLVEQYVADMFAVQDAATGFATLVQQRISSRDPRVGRATRLAQLAWEMRDWSGRQTTSLIAYAGLGLPLSGEQTETLAVFKGSIAQTWGAMRATAAWIDRPDITAAMGAVQDGFWARGGEAFDTWVPPHRGQAIHLDTDSFVPAIRQVLDTILPVRNAALQEALQESRAQVGALRLQLLDALLLLALGVVATMLASWWFDHRVLSPLAQLTATIHALARGRRDLDVPLRTRGDELGLMARATETLRRHAMDAEAAQQARVDEQHARADEKQSLLGELTRRNDALARLNRELEVLATTDALTGVCNRQTFHARLREAADARIEAGPAGGEPLRLAVHCIDLDLFKYVNDTFGHATGDALLEQVGWRLRGCIGPGDVVARLGGDEFAVLQRGADEARACALATSVMQALCAPYDLAGRCVAVGASVGTAVQDAANPDAERLLPRADLALYRCKQSGRNTHCFFEPGMEAEEKHRLAIRHDLSEALSQGQLRVHYQPLLDLGQDRIIGYEALLRWQHPGRGTIMPLDFIPAAEASGRIVEIGEWVLHRACADAACWPAPMKVAINLSPVQFRGEGLVRAVRAALAESGLAAGRLELEVTESVLLHGNQHVLGIMHELRDLGVRMVLDDFGTGYSSLSYLRTFPFDRIKLDRSFVRDMQTQPGCVAILRSVCSLAHQLGMSTTVEGVEAEAQLHELRRIGFNEAQGFLIGRPGPDRHARPAPRALVAEMAT